MGFRDAGSCRDDSGEMEVCEYEPFLLIVCCRLMEL